MRTIDWTRTGGNTHRVVVTEDVTVSYEQSAMMLADVSGWASAGGAVNDPRPANYDAMMNLALNDAAIPLGTGFVSSVLGSLQNGAANAAPWYGR